MVDKMTDLNLPERFVFVDDEQDFRILVRNAIEDSGYEGAFATCGSGEELLKRLKVLQPELVLLDMKMPDMSGPDVLAALYVADCGKVPVILCTGVFKLEMLEQYKPLGVIGILHKPINFETFLQQISEIWLGHVGSEEAEPEEAAED